jgi:hypothetical protein
MLILYFKVVNFVHFSDQCTWFIAPTKCTILIIYKYQNVSPACFGTSVPSSGSTNCNSQNNFPLKKRVTTDWKKSFFNNSISLAIGFIIVVSCSLKMVHLYCNMSATRI